MTTTQRLLMVAVLITITLAACGSDNKATKVTTTTVAAGQAAPSTTESTTTTTAPPAPLKVGDKVQFDDGTTMQIYSYEQPITVQYLTPTAGMEYASADVEVCATATTKVTYNFFGFDAKTADNRTYGATVARTPEFGSGELPAGAGCLRGFVSFSLPQGQRPVAIVFEYTGYARTSWAL